jgi:hypothetical protein
MLRPSVADQYRQEAARLRREAEIALSARFGAKLISVARQFEKLAAESDRRRQRNLVSLGASFRRPAAKLDGP